MPEFVFNVVITCDEEWQANWVMEDLYDPDHENYAEFEYKVTHMRIPAEYPVSDDTPRLSVVPNEPPYDWATETKEET